MSYGVRVAADARADIKSLEIWLQEELWDELEKLLADPSLLPPDSADGDVTYGFTRDTAGSRHTVFLTISRNDQTHILTLLGVGYRPIERR